MRFRSKVGAAEWAAGALVLAGFGAIAAAWQAAAGELAIALQVPYLLSGAFVGLGLILFAVAIAHIELSRRLAAEEHAAMQEIALSAARTVVALRSRSGT